MPLSDFAVVQTAHDFRLEGPLLTARDGDSTVFVPVHRTALEDHLHTTSLTIADRKLLAGGNLAILGKIAEAKYASGAVGEFYRFGRAYPFIEILLGDIEGAGHFLDGTVLKVANGAGWQRR